MSASDTFKMRGVADRVGFAHTARQIEKVAQRLEEGQPAAIRDAFLRHAGVPPDACWRVAIAPHDDYAYASFMYPLALANVKAPLVIVLGVAHRARNHGVENTLVFDSYTHWLGPYGPVEVSPLREELMRGLPEGTWIVHDALQAQEHSVEAELPFLQHANREVQVVSILVPAMGYARMQELAHALARAIGSATRRIGLEWGRDYALVISTDAVHYGDEGWGRHNFARYGANEAGYRRALEHEKALLQECFAGPLTEDKPRIFSSHTVRDDDYREYRWSWCGRYSVPFGLLTACGLQQVLGAAPLTGKVLGYATSLDSPRIEVADLDGMGNTAPANVRHWVGYAAVGFL